MAFRVGQRVVCVNDTPPRIPGYTGTGMPVKGSVYTISETGLTHPGDAKMLPCVHVAEIPNRDQPLWAHRFRPFVEKKGSTKPGMKILRKIAADAIKKREISVVN